MEFRFDPKQPYQQEAIAAVVDLFEDPPARADTFETKLNSFCPILSRQFRSTTQLDPPQEACNE